MLTIFLIFILGIAISFTTWAGDREMTAYQAGLRLAFIGALAALWMAVLWIFRDFNAVARFLAGYTMEWALSMDNLIAIAMVFTYFKLPKQYEPRILNYGMISVVVFRLLFTLVGAGLVAHWGRFADVLLGATVLATAVKMYMTEGEDNVQMVDHNSRWYVQGLRQWLRVTGRVSEPVFFFKEKSVNLLTNRVDSTTYATPLLTCLIAVEVTDLAFSADSVPTVIAMAHDPLIIYSAMVFAVLGLRSMYHLVVAANSYLTRMPMAVVGVLFFVAMKMLLERVTGLHLNPWFTLSVVLSVLGAGLYSSLEAARATRERA